ncbi:MAG: cell division protein SepF [Bacilli bacterium]|nr:cell division protein SepF [bacterium]MDY3756985.1 cell division protein SepF [Bacilli bacterium]
MAFSNFKKAIFGDEDDRENENLEEEFYSVSEKSLKDEDGKAGSKMILVEPRAYSESQTIAEHLKKRNSVVVNLKRVTSDQAKRIIDFLTGCIYAIGGDLQKLGNGIYLCTPKNVSVQGKMTDQDAPSKKVEDEIDF